MRNVAAVGGQVVPLLAGDLARLAADAHRRVGEEAHALGAVARRSRARSCCSAVLGGVVAVGGDAPAACRGRRRAWRSSRVAPRPARTSQVNALDSWIDDVRVARERDQVVGGVARCAGAARSPSATGSATWWIDARRRSAAAASASVTFARASISAARRSRSTIQPPSSIPRSAREHRVDLGEHLGLQLGQPRQVAAHRAGRVVLGQPEGRRRRTGSAGRPVGASGLSGRVPAQRRRVRVDVGVQQVGDRRLERLVVRRQRPVEQARSASTARRGRRPS